jgi:hypothetical protein
MPALPVESRPPARQCRVRLSTRLTGKPSEKAFKSDDETRDFVRMS